MSSPMAICGSSRQESLAYTRKRRLTVDRKKV